MLFVFNLYSCIQERYVYISPLFAVSTTSNTSNLIKSLKPDQDHSDIYFLEHLW